MQIPWIQTENIPLCYRPGSNSTLLIFLLPFLRFAREGCVPICWYLKKNPNTLWVIASCCVFWITWSVQWSNAEELALAVLVVQPHPDTFSEPKNVLCWNPLWPASSSKRLLRRSIFLPRSLWQHERLFSALFCGSSLNHPLRICSGLKSCLHY